jgi:hypothetical protein
MTMRTYEYFSCPNGHQGEEKTSENDQPYSQCWEKVSTKGMRVGPEGKYLCSTCGAPMSRVPKPNS